VSGRFDVLTAGLRQADAVSVRRKLVLIALQVVAVAAVFVLLGGPGRFLAVGLAAIAWRYFIWGDES
jgi:hypothetical protein